MFGDFDGSKDASAAAPGSNPPEPPFPSRELTLSSYLCDKAPPAAAGPSSPPNPEAAAGSVEDAAANAKLCVERDFLHLTAPKRRDPPGDDSSVVGGKKPRLESLQLSLSLSTDAPAPPPASLLPQSQFASFLPVDGDLRCGHRFLLPHGAPREGGSFAQRWRQL
jgi:hypothetical protein